MREGHMTRTSRLMKSYTYVLFFFMIFLGCQPKKEPLLSPAAASFKKEVKQAIGMLAEGLVEPVSRSNVAAINATLKQIMPESIKLCRACPFMIAILDKKGVVLTVYPQRQGYSRHYSDYKLVVHALEKGETCHGRLFLQDGSKLYTICAPLLKEGKAVGVIVLTTTGREVQQKWGISEQEFFIIDFNR